MKRLRGSEFALFYGASSARRPSQVSCRRRPELAPPSTWYRPLAKLPMRHRRAIAACGVEEIDIIAARVWPIAHGASSNSHQLVSESNGATAAALCPSSYHKRMSPRCKRKIAITGMACRVCARRPLQRIMRARRRSNYNARNPVPSLPA